MKINSYFLLFIKTNLTCIVMSQLTFYNYILMITATFSTLNSNILPPTPTSFFSLFWQFSF